MPNTIDRESQLPETVTIDSTLADCDPIDLTGTSLPGLIVPAGASGTLTYHVAEAKGGTYVPLNDKDATALTITVAASQAYALHEALFPFPWAKLLTSGAAFEGLICKKG